MEEVGAIRPALRLGRSAFVKTKATAVSQEVVILKEDTERGDEAYIVTTPDSHLWRLRLSKPHVEDFRILSEDRAIPAGIDESDCFLVNQATHDGFFSGLQLARLITRADELLGESGVAAAGAAPRRALVPMARPVGKAVGCWWSLTVGFELATCCRSGRTPRASRWPGGDCLILMMMVTCQSE
jgi:hypothetical protein